MLNEIEVQFDRAEAMTEFEVRFTRYHDEMPREFAPLSYAFSGDAADTAENIVNEIAGARVVRRASF